MARHWTKQIPNALSISRIFLALLFPFVAPELRIVLVVLALLSEFFDGYLARRLDAVTPLGTALDPIADKLFVLATVIVLIMEKRLGWFAFSLVAMRDIVVAIGSFTILMQDGPDVIRTMKPRISGKVATAFQFMLLVSLYARWQASDFLLIVTAVASCASGVDYLYAVNHKRFDPLST